MIDGLIYPRQKLSDAFVFLSFEIVSACVCVCVTVALRLSTWNLTLSLINVRGPSQALHASFSRDRHIFGLLLTHRVRLGSTLAVS